MGKRAVLPELKIISLEIAVDHWPHLFVEKKRP